jgi:hypothetical protein
MAEKRKTLVIVCRDEDNSLENLLTYIKKTAGIGHSFVVHVDPEDREFSKRFSIDGDGADKIYSITRTEG